MLKGQYNKLMIGDKGPIKKVYEGDELIWQKPWIGIKGTTTDGSLPTVKLNFTNAEVLIDSSVTNGWMVENIPDDLHSLLAMLGDQGKVDTVVFSGIDTSNVTNMSEMFDSCSSLTSLDVTSFNTSKVTEMFGMFLDCSSLTSLDVSSFDTANVGLMGSMFAGCSGLSELDVSNFNTSKVTNLSHMFQECSGLTTLDLSNFDVSNVTNFVSLFLGCTSLTKLDLSNFVTSKVTDVSYMFMNCTSLVELDVSNFVFSDTTDRQLFLGCSQLAKVKVTNCSDYTISRLIYRLGYDGTGKTTWHQEGEYLVP